MPASKVRSASIDCPLRLPTAEAGIVLDMRVCSLTIKQANNSPYRGYGRRAVICVTVRV
jgi:hypothetical protein